MVGSDVMDVDAGGDGADLLLLRSAAGLGFLCLWLLTFGLARCSERVHTKDRIDTDSLRALGVGSGTIELPDLFLKNTVPGFPPTPLKHNSI